SPGACAPAACAGPSGHTGIGPSGHHGSASARSPAACVGPIRHRGIGRSSGHPVSAAARTPAASAGCSIGWPRGHHGSITGRAGRYCARGRRAAGGGKGSCRGAGPRGRPRTATPGAAAATTTTTTAPATAAEDRPIGRLPRADDDRHPFLRQAAGHLHGLENSRIDGTGPRGGERICVLIRVPDGPGHLDAAPSDPHILQRVVDDLRVGARVLQAEVAAEAIEHLAWMRRVERDFDRFLVELGDDPEGEAVLAGLSGGSFAADDGDQYLEVVAALAAVVAHHNLGRLVERHLDLARDTKRAPLAVACKYSFCSSAPAAREVRSAVGGSGSVSSTEPPEKTEAGSSMPRKAPPMLASSGEVNSRSTLAVAGPVSST